MWYLRRLSLLWFLLVGLVIPGVTLLAVSVQQVALNAPPAPSSETPSLAQGVSFRGSSEVSQPQPLPHPILTAGTDNSLWLVRTVQVETEEGKRVAFQLLEHEANSKGPDNRDLWTLVQTPGKAPFFYGTPSHLALVPGRGAASGTERRPATAYVLTDSGWMFRFGLDRSEEAPRLPADQHAVSAVGAEDAVYVLARGPRPALPTPASFPATVPNEPVELPTPAVATATASAPAAETWTLFRYAEGRWTPTILGRVGDPELPSADARVLLQTHSGRIWLCWCSPAAPRMLVCRTWARDEAQSGSPVQRIELPEEPVRLLGVSIAPQTFVAWPVRVNSQIELHGMALTFGGSATRPAANAGLLVQHWALPPLKLGAISATADPTRDVGLAQTANSLMAIVANNEGECYSLLFSAGGDPLSSVAAPVAPEPPQESLITQNVLLVGMLVLLAVAMWQSRRRPMMPRLPKAFRLASLRQRVLASVIDLGVPLGIVVVAFGLYQEGRWQSFLNRWGEALRNLSVGTHSPELLWLFGLYIGHVTIGELVVGRSLGKALLGLRIVAVDGSRPAPIAVLLRNLVRLPELLYPILLCWMFFNEQRQRVGDLLGRTVVIEDAPAEVKERGVSSGRGG